MKYYIVNTRKFLITNGSDKRGYAWSTDISLAKVFKTKKSAEDAMRILSTWWNLTFDDQDHNYIQTEAEVVAMIL
jgi:hypothetical protein